MERWGRNLLYKRRVQFLCICVDALHVAQQFDAAIGFQGAKNAYISAAEHMPRGFGQLGCSGFVVVDHQGFFVSKKTIAFLDYGDEAFRYVEGLLDTVIRQYEQEKEMELQQQEEQPKQQWEEEEEEKKNLLQEEMEETKEVNQSSSDPTNTINLQQVPLTPSVGVESMDQDHHVCTQALQDLLDQGTAPTLQLAIQVLKDHFVHEEALMKLYNFGGATSTGHTSFSAFASHSKDHERILHIGLAELQRLDQFMTSSSSSCNDNTGY